MDYWVSIVFLSGALLAIFVIVPIWVSRDGPRKDRSTGAFKRRDR